MWSYAAADSGWRAAVVRKSTQTTGVVLKLGAPAGGGRVLRMCRCLQEDTVWKRKQNEVEAVLMGASGISKGNVLGIRESVR